MAVGATLLLLAASLGPARAQDSSLSLRPSAEVHYTAGTEQVFELQGSRDLAAWRDVGDVVFGEGERVSSFFPAAPQRAGYNFFRINITGSKNFGFSPKNLTGMKLWFNDEGEAQEFTFSSRSSGSAGDDPFSYSYRKTGAMLGRLTVARGGGETDRFDLDFSADLVGTYTRTNLVDGATRDIDRGTFSLSRRSHPSTDPPAAITPESLVGLTYLFSDGDNDERLDFVTPTGGRAIDRAEVEHFTYGYSAAAGTGTATVGFPGDVVVEFEIHHAGHSCGTYLRRELVDGAVADTSTGIFSCASSVYHTGGAESTRATLPADDLSGRTYVMRDGGTPCRLVFEDGESGRCVEGSRVVPFDFDYVVRCAATSTVTIHFGAGDSDVYHLNHSDMTFVRDEMRGGEEQDSDLGTFSEIP